jgi:DNA-binding transcriptional LysR family regulator
LERVYETDMAAGLKAMALEGHGIAFLPLSAVKKELLAQKLVSAGAGFETPMDVRIYRERPSAKISPKRLAQAVWTDLQTQVASQPLADFLRTEKI